jgi:16S rRNA (cytidine1402-2'-O)-methyltransferase
VSGTLQIVATPIGNLEDVTLRALRVLREAQLILAEDTRRTKTLLAHHAIGTPLASLHAHTAAERVQALAEELAAGKRYALVSDAGTPLVSDPGRELVEAALARGVSVEAIPGPSALLSALCVAGLRADQFRFLGFLPRSGRRRREALASIAHDRASTVLFESPNRLGDTLRELSALCAPERRAAVCRELTKLHEEVARGTLQDLARRFEEPPKGEITLVIEAAAPDEPGTEDDDAAIDVGALLAARRAAGVSPREVAKELASLLGIDRREAYKRVVEHKLKGEEG